MYPTSAVTFLRCKFAANLAISQFKRCLSAATLDFHTAQDRLKTLKKEPSTDAKLKLYGLYKQASIGDATDRQFGARDVQARAQFDAWKTLAGVPKEAAMEQYAEIVMTLLANEEVISADDFTLSELKKIPGLNITVDGAVLRVALNRPEKYNALTVEMYEGIMSALKYADTAEEISLTVFSGNGDYFSAGNDLSLFGNVKSIDDFTEIVEKAGGMFERYVETFVKYRKPLLVFINGPAVGIAVTTLPLADLALASEKSTFLTPFSPLGFTPEGCSTYTFPLLMGSLKSSEVLTFNRKLTAREAFERNLVNEVIPASSFGSETQQRLDAILKFTPETLRLSKKILRSVHLEALLETNKREVKLLKQRWLSKDSRDAIMKFMKRKA